MRDLAELGIRPRRRNPLLPTTDGDIAGFESNFGVTLPPSFVQLLKHSNGGRPCLSVYTDPYGALGGVDEFYGLGSKSADDEAAARGTWNLSNLWGETRVRRPLLSPEAVPFGRDGGDNQLYLNLGSGGGSVWRLIQATRQKYQIAVSFDEFVDMLRPPAEMPRRPRQVIVPKHITDGDKPDTDVKS